jgi:hypothetical protein
MIKLASLLKEEPLVPVSTEHIPEQDNTYMFFQNLQTICNATKELLEMNPEQISKLLADGHGWALDHIATSTDDISEVYQFVKNSLTENHLQEAEEVGAPTTKLTAVKAGGIVVPMAGPHKGIKHLVTYSKGNRLNIKPMGLKPGQNKYAAGTTAVNINQVKILKEDLGKYDLDYQDKKILPQIVSALEKIHKLRNKIKIRTEWVNGYWNIVFNDIDYISKNAIDEFKSIRNQNTFFATSSLIVPYMETGKTVNIHFTKKAQDFLDIENFDKNTWSPIKNTSNLKEDLGAFRRLVITSSKSDLLKKELEDFMKRPNIKSDYAGMKFNMKPGAKPDVIVVDIEGQSGTALANKLSDIAKKFDKGAQIKVRKELKLKPTK